LSLQNGFQILEKIARIKGECTRSSNLIAHYTISTERDLDYNMNSYFSGSCKL
jgi:hypothetical protein